MVSPTSGSTGSQPIQPLEPTQKIQEEQKTLATTFLTQSAQYLYEMNAQGYNTSAIQTKVDEINEKFSAGTITPEEATTQLNSAFQEFYAQNKVPESLQMDAFSLPL